MRRRTVLYHAMRSFLEGYDVLAIPVVGLEPQPVEIEYPTEVDGQPVADYIDWLRFSFLATTTALPALSMPVGFTKSGMPVGLQLVGPPRGEAKLLRVARAVEDAVAFPGRRSTRWCATPPVRQRPNVACRFAGPVRFGFRMSDRAAAISSFFSRLRLASTRLVSVSPLRASRNSWRALALLPRSSCE